MYSNIKIILVNPSHPGNIGATARAMKTMDLTDLHLISPKKFPHVDATARAAGADDILANAKISDSLSDALKDTQIVFGTSSRSRVRSLPLVNPKEAAQLISQQSSKYNIAIVFGRENNGLTNEEMELCNYHIYIPTNPDFYSLNLASAVQLISYEIKLAAAIDQQPINHIVKELATSEDIQLFYQQLHNDLIAINFLNPKNQNKVFSKLKVLFNRAHLEKTEISILRGILTKFENKLKIKE